VFNGADNLQSLPIVSFRASRSGGGLPTLSEKYTLQKLDGFNPILSGTLDRFVFDHPMMMLYWLLRAQSFGWRSALGQLAGGYALYGFDAGLFTFGMARRRRSRCSREHSMLCKILKTPFGERFDSLVNVGAAHYSFLIEVVAWPWRFLCSSHQCMLLLLFAETLGGLGLRPLWLMAGKF